MNKYTAICKLENYQYIDKCPVFITGGNLVKQTDTDDIYVQLRLRNNSQKDIFAVILIIDCCDIEGESLDTIKHQYLDMNIKCGEAFGDKELIKCTSKFTRICNITIKTVIFSDKTKWDIEQDYSRVVLGLQKHISDDAELKPLKSLMCKELKSKGFDNVKMEYIPCRKDNYWICTCGLINTVDNICSCGLDLNSELEIFSDDFLDKCKKEVQEKNKKLEEERRRRERQMEEEKAVEERRRQQEVVRRLKMEEEEREAAEKKKTLIIAGIAIGIVVLIFLCMR